MVIEYDRNNLTCLFTEADWEYWFKKQEEKHAPTKLKFLHYSCPYCNMNTTPGALVNHCRCIHRQDLDIQTMTPVDN